MRSSLLVPFLLAALPLPAQGVKFLPLGAMPQVQVDWRARMRLCGPYSLPWSSN